MIVGVGAAPLLAELHAACFPPGERWSDEAMRALLRMPGCFALLATQNDEPAGLAMARVAADEAELLTIGVLPTRRGSGLGRELLLDAGREALRRGAGRLFLEVAAGNAPAATLYARAGFRQAGLRRRYYPNGDDALVLAAGLPLGGDPASVG